MKKANIKKIFIIFLLLLWFYHYPLQRICAEVRLSQYLEEKQQIEVSEIVSKRAWKDFKTANYTIEIVFEGQEDKTYQYEYTFIDHTAIGWQMNQLVAYVRDNETSVVTRIGSLTTPIHRELS